MDQITIECKNITKTFGKEEIIIQPLRGINLVAHENEMIMLMGPSGSGKTTLISIIGGILQQSSGECLILNKPINSLAEEEKTKFRGQNIGFMFQYFNLIPTLNAIENASIPLILNGCPRAQAMEQTKNFLQTIGLETQAYRTPSDLSGGEQQRIALARACIHHPKIILCDEPTSFLDRERGKQIMELLQKIKSDNKCTLIVVTHDPRILGFADRIIEIEDGMLKNQPLKQDSGPM